MNSNLLWWWKTKHETEQQWKIKAVKYCSYKQVETKQKLQPDLYHDHNNATKNNIWAQT